MDIGAALEGIQTLFSRQRHALKKGLNVTQEELALATAIHNAKVRIGGYEVRSEVTTLETLRALDTLYCIELFNPSEEVATTKRIHQSIMGWGANKALRSVLPLTLSDGPFVLFPSTPELQGLADDLLFSAGTIQMAERVQTWIRRGFLSAKLREFSDKRLRFRNVLELADATDSLFSETIGAEGARWRSERQHEADQDFESSLGVSHLAILPKLRKHVECLGNWGIRYSTDREIDDYFMDWAVVYLRRMITQELLSTEDSIGGRTYNEYLGVMVALSARSHKHLCYCSILKDRHPHLMLQNILTTFAFKDELIVGIASQLDADTTTVSTILDHLVLSPSNAEIHLQGDSPCWAPVVQASHDAYLLPLFGLEIAPFNFLLSELKNRYEADWFKLANRREGRWINELNHLFSSRWKTNDKNVRLQKDRRDVTDIDYAIYDEATGELGVFQLKWQQQVGLDTRLTRNAGTNLITEGNKWIVAVTEWVRDNGLSALVEKLGFTRHAKPKISLFVIARYSAYFSGFAAHDRRATWTDWGNFLRTYAEHPATRIGLLARRADEQSRLQMDEGQRESIAFPIDDLAIIVNPTSTPS